MGTVLEVQRLQIYIKDMLSDGHDLSVLLPHSTMSSYSLWILHLTDLPQPRGSYLSSWVLFQGFCILLFNINLMFWFHYGVWPALFRTSLEVALCKSKNKDLKKFPNSLCHKMAHYGQCCAVCVVYCDSSLAAMHDCICIADWAACIFTAWKQMLSQRTSVTRQGCLFSLFAVYTSQLSDMMTYCSSSSIKVALQMNHRKMYLHFCLEVTEQQDTFLLLCGLPK